MHPLLLVIMILFLPVTRLHTQQQLIDWSTERKLTWDDFKASPDQNSPNAALTYAAIKMEYHYGCLLYTSPSPRDGLLSRMPSSA